MFDIFNIKTKMFKTKHSTLGEIYGFHGDVYENDSFLKFYVL
jgi:hypothetical protein